MCCHLPSLSINFFVSTSHFLSQLLFLSLASVILSSPFFRLLSSCFLSRRISPSLIQLFIISLPSKLPLHLSSLFLPAFIFSLLLFLISLLDEYSPGFLSSVTHLSFSIYLSILLSFLLIYFPLEVSISNSLFLPFLPLISQTLNSFSLYSPLLISFFLHNLNFFSYAFYYSLYSEVIGLLKLSSIHQKIFPSLGQLKELTTKNILHHSHLNLNIDTIVP